MKKSNSIATQPADLQSYLDEIRAARKYKNLDLPDSTLRDLVAQEALPGRSHKQIEQAVREKLHNIVAPYLGDPDYAQAGQVMETAFASGDAQAVRDFCQEMLASHASTRERSEPINSLADFYTQLWQATCRPASILDLACGLHPFGLPWMGLPAGTSYHAFDLHHPRVALIDRFLKLSGANGGACHQDILVQPPELEADVALFLKKPIASSSARRAATGPSGRRSTCAGCWSRCQPPA